MTSKKTVPKQAEINIGLVGHVDAGKTSLVKALTGKWTDTHSEELKRGISIRLGYADCVFYKCDKCKKEYSSSETCPDCKVKGTVLRKVSFVDAPGHENLMTTMLSGAALMHGAVLVIAANEECPQAQTVEHLNALKLSGVKNIVVSQNKIDLVNKEEAKKNYKQITDFLKKNGYENTPIIPTAAHFNGNIDLLIQAIEKNIPTPKFDLKKPLKMYCARSFDINKPGTKIKDLQGGVIGGSILQGVVKIGDTIEIAPGNNNEIITTKVLSISSSDFSLKESRPGGLVALGTNLDPSVAQNDQLRGQIIAKPKTLPKPTTKLELGLEFLERVVEEVSYEIVSNEPIVLSIGTMTAIGVAISASKKKVNVLLKTPIIVDKGQKIALSKRVKNKWRLIAYGTVR